MAKNNFTLTLDTLAPEGSITRPAHYLNSLEGKKVTIEKGDAVLMKVWFDTKSVGLVEDAPATFEAVATEKAIVLPKEGTYYAHLILRDEVANDSVIYNSEEIIYDTTAPVVTGFLMTDLDGSEVITNARTVNYVFNYTDNLSGSTSVRIYGDHITEQTFNVSGDGKQEGQIVIKESAPQGDIKVYVTVTDNAGNTCEPVDDVIVLDTAMDTPILAIKGIAEGAWTNADSITAILTSNDTDIVSYKIWEVGTTEPEWTTNATGSKLSVEKVFEVSTEGDHSYTAKVKDSAGTEASAVVRTIKVDQSAPVITDVKVDRNLVSHVADYNVVNFSYKSDCSISGEKSAVVDINGTTYNGDITAIASTNFVEGANTITVTVVDIAGNSNSASVTVTLDTKAPTGIGLTTELNSWYKDENPFGVSVRATDTHSISTMYAWTIGPDGNANVIPEDTKAVAVTGNPQAIAASDIKWGHAQAADNYLCVAVVDEVGNVGYLAPVAFGFDSAKPEGTVKFEKAVYGSQSAKVLIKGSDATSGVVQMKLEGDITSTDWENVAESRSVELLKGDGLKSVKIKFRDNAGNESEWIDGTNKTELDESTPSATITLFKGSDATVTKPQVSAEAETNVKIAYTDVDGRGKVQYYLWGDFVGSVAYVEPKEGEEDTNNWVDFSTDLGSDTKTIKVTAIDPVGDKKVARHFYVIIKDNAGNRSSIASASFYLDPTKPEAAVQDLDHNRISKVNEYRNCIVEQHLKDDSYADEVKFYIAPSEIITEYKVCAYLDAEAAKAGKPTDTAIPMTAGSVHMSGTTNSAERIDCLIKGADYEAALGEVGKVDGAHFVVVYVKNEADLWSASYLEA